MPYHVFKSGLISQVGWLPLRLRQKDYKVKSSLGNLVPQNKYKSTKSYGDVRQSCGAHVTCERPWVQFPVLKTETEKQNQIPNQIFRLFSDGPYLTPGFDF